MALSSQMWAESHFLEESYHEHLMSYCEESKKLTRDEQNFADEQRNYLSMPEDEKQKRAAFFEIEPKTFKIGYPKNDTFVCLKIVKGSEKDATKELSDLYMTRQRFFTKNTLHIKQA